MTYIFGAGYKTSRPTRARGLKHASTERLSRVASVAPHAGAWIETQGVYFDNTVAGVAPHAGAWIETGVSFPSNPFLIVAPHAGAWIETIP